MNKLFEVFCMSPHCVVNESGHIDFRIMGSPIGKVPDQPFKTLEEAKKCVKELQTTQDCAFGVVEYDAAENTPCKKLIYIGIIK